MSKVQKSFTLIFILYLSTTSFWNIHLLDISRKGHSCNYEYIKVLDFKYHYVNIDHLIFTCSRCLR